MATVPFDKLAYIDKLKSSGISDEQARAHPEALDSALRDSVATRQDISLLRTEIVKMIADMLKWLVTILAAHAAFVVALIKLF